MLMDLDSWVLCDSLDGITIQVSGGSQVLGKKQFVKIFGVYSCHTFTSYPI